MPDFHRASEERVNAFRVDEAYLFKHYFEGETIFDRLKRYYDNQQYRFEIPEDDFEEVQAFLADHGYALVEVDDPAAFTVVVEKYTDHPENIFKDSVLHQGGPDHNVFVMKDRVAVEQAELNGATRITETDLAAPV